MGESSEHKQARQAVQANAQAQLQIEQQRAALQQSIYGQISPFAQGLLNMGQNAQKGIAPDSFQLGTRNALAGAFGQSRQNLTDFLGQSGQGFGGLAAGPAANLGAQESTAMGQSYADALNQALGLGLQGSNVLQGQQGVFNPQAYGQMGGQGLDQYLNATPMQGFGASLGQSLLGAGIGAGTSFLTGGLSNLTSGKSFLGCWVAAELYGGWFAPETCAIRNWLWSTWWMRPFCLLYMKIGQRWAAAIKDHSLLRRATKSLFDRFLWASNS